MKRHFAGLMIVTMLALGVITASAQEEAASIAPPEPKPVIQLAILLDTSNSMDGLIDQAREQLWQIVNTFIGATREGQRPTLQVALFEYGKPTLGPETGFIRMIQPLTDDLDKISEELFALKTNGGDEYCGWVIREAVQKLAWSSAPDDLKVIFIAGNEPFTQGSVAYQESCKAAATRGITVNTIFCGSYDEGTGGMWSDGAVLADGAYMNIDQNRQVVRIEAPQDKELAQLGQQLNTTYLAYGADAESASANQAVQDANAASLAPAAAAARSVTKASSMYNNAAWDLIDAQKQGKLKLEEVAAAELPEEMRTMKPEERKAYVETKAAEREQLQQKIQQLSKERNAYVAEETKKRLAAGEDTLDTAIIKMIRTQAEARKFTFEK